MAKGQVITNNNDLESFELPENLNEADINIVKEWLKKQPHLPQVSDKQISTFLHSCCGALEFTKNTIEAYYTIRTRAPELFSGRIEEDIKKTLDTIYCFQLPDLSSDKYNIILAGINDTDPEKFIVPEVVKTFFSIFDIATLEIPYASGWRVAINTRGFSFGHFTRLTSNMTTIKKTICYVQDALPVRLKGIHVFNAIPLINQFIGLIRPFMKKELYDLIYIHSDSDTKSLYDVIPFENFPSNFGGQTKSVNEFLEISKKKVEQYQQWFANDEKCARTNESKRLEKTKSYGDIFSGMDGSFKKLNFD